MSSSPEVDGTAKEYDSKDCKIVKYSHHHDASGSVTGETGRKGGERAWVFGSELLIDLNYRASHLSSRFAPTIE